jgi:hypothetical protein
MAHSGATLAEFQEGETRLIYARRRQGDTTLFELEDGTAATIRDWAKKNLLCPVDSCESPALTTVNRGARARDGFMHLVRTNDHGPESLFHIEAKGQIAKWLRLRYPRVIVREEEASNKNRDRIADIMATAVNGDRIAIEIQYSYLSPEVWLERHESYRAQNIVDVWLFGHHGDQLTRVRGTEDQVVLSPTHELAIECGMPLLWINPVLGRIGTAIEHRTIDGRPADIMTTLRTGRFVSDALNSFALHPQHGLANPRMEIMLAAALELERRRVADLLAKAVSDERERRRLDAVAKLEETEAKRKEEERNAVVARMTETRNRWFTEGVGSGILAGFGGVWPEWLAVNVEPAFPYPAEMWQSHVYLKMVVPAEPEAWIRRDECATELVREFGSLGMDGLIAQAAIRQWFEVLVKEGHLMKRAVRLRYGEKATKFLRAYKWQSEPRATIAESYSRDDAHRPATSAAGEETWGGRRATDILPRPAPRRTGYTCGTCSQPLDVLLAKSGYHIGCQPGRDPRSVPSLP